jgi:hypothetical protein
MEDDNSDGHGDGGLWDGLFGRSPTSATSTSKLAQSREADDDSCMFPLSDPE